MPFDIPKSVSNFKLPPAGTHVAILLSIVDLGTQERTIKGEKKHERQLRFTWELPYEKEQFGEDPEPRPFVVSKDYTLSMSERAFLRKDLESWRGKPFTDEEARIFDEKKVLGRACQVTILHKTVASGKTYANITGVVNISKGTTVPEPHGAVFSYDTKEGNSATYQSFPEWLQEKIGKSPEFQLWSGKKDRVENEPQGNAGIGTPEGEEGPDIPFAPNVI